MSLPKVIRDPVHNLIEIPDDDEGRMILALIDRPEFQRLRRIRQLGLGFLVYPGAEHSRWAHSLGVCHVARRMLDALAKHHGENSEEYRDLKPLRRTILAAALLHDVGHGPFSHVFERAIKPPNGAETEYPRDHEGWSRRIIKERLGDLLERHEVDAQAVCKLLDKKDRGNPLGKDFVSSQLDADRMDYLLRDSKACGPRYGEFDLEWMLHGLRIARVGVPGSNEPTLRLSLDSGKARHVVEEFIQAREFIYLQVYIHRTTRAYEALLTNILGLASDIAGGDPARVPEPCPQPLRHMLAGTPVSVEAYLSLDDFRLWCMLSDWSYCGGSADTRINRLARMCSVLVNRGRPYKVVVLEDDESRDQALEFVTRIEHQEFRFACLRDLFTDVAYRNALYRPKKHEPAEGDRIIHFLDRSGIVRPAESESEVIRAISEIKTTVARFYYDAEDGELVKALKSESWFRPDREETGEDRT